MITYLDIYSGKISQGFELVTLGFWSTVLAIELFSQEGFFFYSDLMLVTEGGNFHDYLTMLSTTEKSVSSIGTVVYLNP